MTDYSKFSTMRPSLRQRPLMMQLALASGALAQPSLLRGKNFTDEFWNEHEGRQARASMEKVVEGLRRYQLHPYERPPQRASVVWAEGESRILWYAARGRRGRSKAKAAVFLIPSMINGPEILDILPERRSLVRWLSAQGIEVFLWEWGHLCADAELATLDKAIAGRLSDAVAWLQKEVDIPLFGVGYCMGGLFLAAAEILNPDGFAGLVFIATPWDFHAGAKGNFAEAIAGWAPDGLRRVGALDYLPNEWLQMIFAGVEPAMVARKFSAFADMDTDSPEAELFVAVEDWVNGGADLPAGVILQTVRHWYLDNKVVKGQWVVAKRKIDARKIEKPALVIIPSKDKIVPPASARPLSRQIKGADVLVPECGHISMMVGGRAEDEVWEPLKDWLMGQI